MLRKPYTPYILEAIALIIFFFVAQLPLRDFDIWFHIKSGELFVQQGHLQTTEVFSYAAAGREWTTFEWLFQIGSYYISKIGLWAIPPATSLFVVVGFFFLLRIFDYIFGLPIIARLLLTYAFWVSTYEFNTARPHTIAYTFLIVELFLILARIYKQKHWVWWTPVLTLIWSNIHSTGFLSWGFFLSFGLIALVLRRTYTKELLLLAIINAGMTLLPPMGIADYKLLWRFFREREFLGYFISEWAPPTDNPFGFWVYTATSIVTVVLWMIVSIKNTKGIHNFILLPFIIMMIGGFTAARNIYLGTLGLLLLLAYSIKDLNSFIKPNYRYWIYFILIICTSVFYTWVYGLKYIAVHNNRLYYPLQATEFIRTYRLQGNMFNDYNYGAYMLYRMYPDFRVFIDGRADVYECCEMRDYLLLAYNKRLTDTEYRKFLDTFWDKYNISYAVIVTTKHNVMRKIATLLATDPNWALVFWDDDSQIFIRRDGKNDRIISTLEATAATPYLRNPYKAGMEEDALNEYMRMDTIAKSARTSNAIGYLYLKQNKFDEAKTRFDEAINLDPSFESPYMNMAELSAKDKDYTRAIALYYQAHKRAPDRGLIYVRLGQLTLLESRDKEKTRKIWNDGIKFTVDEDARNTLKELVESL